MSVHISSTERIADELGDLDDPVDGCSNISLDVFIGARDQIQMAKGVGVGRWVRVGGLLDWAKESVADSDTYIYFGSSQSPLEH